MIKKSITFFDLDGKKVTEDHYFHMSKADIARYKINHGAELTARIRELIAKRNIPAMIEVFEEILEASYGRRSEDGRRFIKDPKEFQEFKQTEAYSQIFFELATGAEASADFVRGMVPADIATGVEDLELPDDPDELLKVFDKLVEDEKGGNAKVIELPVQPQKMPDLVLPPGGDGVVVTTSASPLGVKSWDDYTRDEILAMSNAEFYEIFGADHEKWPRLVLNASFERSLRTEGPYKA